MFFDLHSDILYDIVKKSLDDKTNIIKDYHLKQYHEGEIIGGIWTYYTNINNPLCDFNQALDYILEELEEANDVIKVIKCRNDFDFNKINVILGLESLQPVKDVEHLSNLYNLGFRHAMLTWNEANQYGTGVNGDASCGLTDEGIAIIEFMNEANMIIDISHANTKTTEDILNITAKPIIASHSNIYELCPNKRNLTIQQIDKIVQNKGIIGITAVKNMVNPQNPCAKEMVKHIEFLRQRNYINHIALGFDFMDYMNESNLDDLKCASDTAILLKEFDDLLYSEIEIDQICFLNALALINNLLE
ncbi:MAG TPA: membrane dipeptidase [Haloplasmataceae bacterium]